MKKKSAWIIICVMVIICVISSGSFESIQQLVMTKRAEKIDADTVIMLHSSDGRTYSEEVTITEKEAVSELLSMHNSLKIMEMSRPLAVNRKCIVFYKNDVIITEWHISIYEDDGMLITSSDTFGIGNHVVKSDFDYNRVIEIFNEAND